MRHIVVIAASLVICACAAPYPSASTPLATWWPFASGEIALPTESPVSLPSGAIEACAGVGIGAVLHGDAADPRVTWLLSDLGSRIDVVWPPGYRARFNPELQVLDASEDLVLKAGDPITGACVLNADPRILLLEPPFK